MQTFNTTHHVVDSAVEAHKLLAQLVEPEVVTEDVGIGPYEYGSSRGWDSEVVTYIKDDEGEAVLTYAAKCPPQDVMDFGPMPMEADFVDIKDGDHRIEMAINYTAEPTVVPSGDHYIITQPLSWTLEVK